MQWGKQSQRVVDVTKPNFTPQAVESTSFHRTYGPCRSPLSVAQYVLIWDFQVQTVGHWRLHRSRIRMTQLTLTGELTTRSAVRPPLMDDTSVCSEYMHLLPLCRRKYAIIVLTVSALALVSAARGRFRCGSGFTSHPAANTSSSQQAESHTNTLSPVGVLAHVFVCAVVSAATRRAAMCRRGRIVSHCCVWCTVV